MYDVDYFIDKFEKIPEELWCVGRYGSFGVHCANGHCGAQWAAPTLESEAIYDLFRKYLNQYVSGINDGDDIRYQQPTPRARILAALRDIKNMQPRKDITASLAQDAVQERLDVVKPLVKQLS